MEYFSVYGEFTDCCGTFPSGHHPAQLKLVCIECVPQLSDVTKLVLLLPPLTSANITGGHMQATLHSQHNVT